MEKIQVFASFFNKKWRKEKNKKRKNLYIGETVGLALEKFKRETGVDVSSSQLYSFLCDEYLKAEEIKNSGKFRPGNVVKLRDEYIPLKNYGESYDDYEEMDPFGEIEESDEAPFKCENDFDFGAAFDKGFNSD